MRCFSWLIFLVMGCLQSCSLIDDYVLGKDNTLKPKPLAAIHPKVQLINSWSTVIGKASKSHAYYKLKPVTIGSIIYTADPKGKVTAVDRHQGKLLWSTQVAHELVSGPTVAHGYLIVGSDAATLVALSQKDGHQIWEAQLSEDALSKSAVTSDAVIAKTIDGHLYAFDLVTGKQRWMVDHGSPHLILKASSSPKILGTMVMVGYSDGKLDAVDVATGRMIWQRSIAYANGVSDVERLVDIDADPMIRDNVAFLASYQGYIGALKLDDGQFIWSKRASVYKNMVMDQDTVYVTDSSDILWAYQLHSGQVKWKQMALKGYGVTEPVLLDHRLIVGDMAGNVHVVSKSNGELIGRHNVGAAIVMSPAVAGDQLVLMTTDGLLQSFYIKVIS